MKKATAWLLAMALTVACVPVNAAEIVEEEEIVVSQSGEVSSGAGISADDAVMIEEIEQILAENAEETSASGAAAEDETDLSGIGTDGLEAEKEVAGTDTEETAVSSDEGAEELIAADETSAPGAAEAQEETAAAEDLAPQEEASEAETLHAQDEDAEAEDQASGIVLDIEVEIDPEDEPATIASGAYTVSGTTITVSVTSDADISANVNAALKAATSMGNKNTQITVKVPEGSYKLGSALLIYSYTTLDVTGCTLTSTKTEHNLLQTGDSTYNTSSACAGYGGYTNVTVIGGTWKGSDSNTASLMRFLHATNVTVEGVTLDGGGCTHQMEVAAINGFTVTGCTFQNHGTATYGDAHVNQEVLQMDIPVSDDVIKETYQDGTTMKNVTITGNTFSKVYRGVGTHTMLYGAYHENIVISDNTFKNVYEECIICLNYYNCKVQNNTITNCGGGILINNFKVSMPSAMNTTIFNGTKAYSGTFRTDLATTVSGNVIKLKYEDKWGTTCNNPDGIVVYGAVTTSATTGLGDGTSIPAGNYYAGGVTITDNTITTCVTGIYMTGASNCTVSGNTIKLSSSSEAPDTVYDGILVENYSTGITLSKNTLSKMQTGICVQKYASVSSITGNEISGTTKRGISVNNNGTVTGAISGNTITSSANGGIVLSSGGNAGSIANNTIKKTKGSAAIIVTGESSVGGAVSGNKITDTNAAVVAIQIATNSSVQSISGNTISKTSSDSSYSCLRGILVYSDSVVSGAITGNTIENAKQSGIFVSSNSTVKGSIDTNTITNVSTGPAINVYSGSTSGAITGNTIKNVNSGQVAIRVLESSTASAITNNTITKTSGTYSCGKGIVVTTNSTVSGDISANTVSDAKGSAILVSTSSSVAGAISSNTLTNAATAAALYVYDKSTVGAVSGNTISGVTKSPGISIYKNSTAGAISNNQVTDVNSAKSAIYIGTNSKAASISGNTIAKSAGSYSAKIGIQVTSSSTVTGAISKNTISNTKGAGISISSSSAVKGKVSSNKVTSAAANGIEVLSESTVVGKISSNTIKSCKKYGIYLNSIQNNVTITKNKISGCSDYPMLINPGTTDYTVTISSNKLTGKGSSSTAYGICIKSGKVVTSGNTIKKVKTKIYAASGVKLTKN